MKEELKNILEEVSRAQNLPAMPVSELIGELMRRSYLAGYHKAQEDLTLQAEVDRIGAEVWASRNR
jgi:hypothetical protein